MPNHPVMVSGAIIVVSVAVAAAIAVYESPQARRLAEDVRRKIAVALHSLGDEINPSPSRQPRFNRPEDAEGFLQSQAGADLGVDADEESKRRQREELMYWNAVHLEKLEKERKLNGDRPANKSRGSSFDDFLKQDESAEKGTFVYNTGADVHREAEEEGLRNRGVRGLNRGALYANPFGDEHTIEAETQRAIDASLISPDPSERFEVMSDIYAASEPKVSRETTATIAQLIDISDPVPDPPISYPTMETVEQSESTNFTNMGARDDSPFASIHAWADNANANSFYSPLPVTPQQHESRPGSPTFSDPDVSVPGSGDATPTDSASLADSAENVWAPRSGATSESDPADVLSIDGDGIPTPGTWTEVGSVVSENDVGSGVHN